VVLSTKVKQNIDSCHVITLLQNVTVELENFSHRVESQKMGRNFQKMVTTSKLSHTSLLSYLQSVSLLAFQEILPLVIS